MKLRAAIQYAIQGDLSANLTHTGQFKPHVLDALENSLIMSITKALMEYDRLKSEEN
jgi:hypothetical protein